VACDPSEAFVAHARRHQADPRVSFVVAGVGDLPTRAGGFDCVATLLALNFFPDPGAAVEEMRRIASRHGLVAAAVWDYAGGMELLRRFWDAALSVDVGAAAMDEGGRFPICRPDALEALFRRAGLAEVVCGSIEIPVRFSTFAEYWQPFLGGTGPAPSYVGRLDASQRAALAARLEESLPRESDGTIAMSAQAWVVRGIAG
jgi:SAM-dependent methyltransferase